MTFAILFLSLWLLANLFLQVASVPIWLPLAIVLFIIILVWWGLSRNDSRQEVQSPSQDDLVSDNLGNGADLTAQNSIVLSEHPDPNREGAAQTDGIDKDERELTLPEPDDFKIIEGIGPKIADILAEAGINTYDQLANSEVADLERIVRVEAGIRVANPASWPQQAAFAAAGDWSGLEEMQHQLIAGRHRK